MIVNVKGRARLMINSFDAWECWGNFFLFGTPSLEPFSEAANYAVPAADCNTYGLYYEDDTREWMRLGFEYSKELRGIP